MTKRVKNLLIACSVLVLFIVVFLILKLTEAPALQEDSSDVQTAPVVQFFEQEKENVNKVSVKNLNGEYTVVKNNSSWIIPENYDAPLNESTISVFIDGCTGLTSKQTVEENAQDITKYGLKSPTAEVKIEYNDENKTIVEFLIGNVVPTAAQYYFSLKGSNDVYTVNKSAVSSFLNSNLDFIQTQLTPTFNSEAPQNVNKMTIERKDLEKPIIIDIIPVDENADEEDLTAGFTTHKLSSPVSVNVDSSRSQTIIYGFFGLSAEKAVWVNPTEVDYELAGLNEPNCVVTVDIDGEIYTLSVGGLLYEEIQPEIEGQPVTKNLVGAYAMINGIDVLYQISIDYLPWLVCDAGQIISRIPLLPYIYSIEYVEVITDSGTYKFMVEGNSDDEKFTLNGNVLDSERFKEFYQYLLGTVGEELNFEPVTGTKIVSIRYKYKNNTKSDDIMEIYTAEDRKNAVVINGEPLYRVRQIYGTKFISNLEKLLSGEGEIDLNW